MAAIKIIGIDHGYGYMKTAHSVFPSGLQELDVEPPFSSNLLCVEDRIYAVGQVRQNHPVDKTEDEDYYYLTLAGIAKELKYMGQHKADVVIAAGLPYSFLSVQGKSFKKYLLRKEMLKYQFDGEQYEVKFVDAHIFPQGFPYIAKKLEKYKDMVSVIDIGSRTIDVLTFLDGDAQYDLCFSIDRAGVLDCVEMVMKSFTGKYQIQLEERLIQDYLQGKHPKALNKEQISLMDKIIRRYVKEVGKNLEAKGIHQFSHKIYCGGGAGVMQLFGNENNAETEYCTDIHANASGYEILARTIRKGK